MLNQLLSSRAWLQPPRALHPIFYGCLDWHSSVHGHWLLARAALLFPSTQLARNVTRVFTEQFTEEKVGVQSLLQVAGELVYLEQAEDVVWERTYGWAWLLRWSPPPTLRLQEELEEHGRRWGTPFAKILRPLAALVKERFIAYLPKLHLPVRWQEACTALSFPTTYQGWRA